MDVCVLLGIAVTLTLYDTVPVELRLPLPLLVVVLVLVGREDDESGRETGAPASSER